MAQNIYGTAQRKEEWSNVPKIIAFRHRLARAEEFADSITNGNMTEALVDRLAEEIDALSTDDILNTQYGHEEFMPEINHLGDILALLDHEIARKRRQSTKKPID